MGYKLFLNRIFLIEFTPFKQILPPVVTCLWSDFCCLLVLILVVCCLFVGGLEGKNKALAVTLQLTAKAFPLSFTIDGNLYSVLINFS